MAKNKYPIMYTITLMVIVSTTISSYSQSPEQIRENAMAKLSFMLGQWEGPGWYINKDGKKENFIDHETMRLSEDEKFLIMDVNTINDDNTLKSQIFVFYYDTDNQQYVFNAFSGRGGPYKLPCEIISPNKMRCTNDKGTWRFTYTRTGNSLIEAGEKLQNGKWFFTEKTIVEKK